MTKVSIIAAISKGKRALGKDNQLLWHIPDDLKRFKNLTSGHPIIMGRKTYESIGRSLPNRTNIIITRNLDYDAEDCLIADSLEEALRRASKLSEEVFIIGGGEVYKQALPLVNKLYLTIIDREAEADTFFPAFDEFTKKTFEQEGQYKNIKFTWLDLERP